MSDNHTSGPDFSDLVSQIGSMSFDSTRLHWRYFPKYLSSSCLDVFFLNFILVCIEGEFWSNGKGYCHVTKRLQVQILEAAFLLAV